MGSLMSRVFHKACDKPSGRVYRPINEDNPRDAGPQVSSPPSSNPQASTPKISSPQNDTGQNEQQAKSKDKKKKAKKRKQPHSAFHETSTSIAKVPVVPSPFDPLPRFTKPNDGLDCEEIQVKQEVVIERTDS